MTAQHSETDTTGLSAATKMKSLCTTDRSVCGAWKPKLGLGTEIVKNLVLAGIGSLTILDSHRVKDEDYDTQFFLPKDAQGQYRAEAALPQISALNPRVNLAVHTARLSELPDSFFTPFDVLLATELPLAEMCRVNDLSRSLSKPFFAGGLHGMYGYIFLDLISHTYRYDRVKGNLKTVIGPETAFREIVSASTRKEGSERIETVVKKDVYVSLSDVLARKPILHGLRPRQLKKLTAVLPLVFAGWELDSKEEKDEEESPEEADRSELDSALLEVCAKLGVSADIVDSESRDRFARWFRAEFSPTAAILGGALGQEVLNFLGGKEQPINNFLVFDGVNSVSPIFSLY